MVTRSIENAQRKVEARNFDIRKQLLEYDDVANDQRKVIYQQRNELLESPSLAAQIASLRASAMGDVVRSFVPADSVEEQWDLARPREEARDGMQRRRCRSSRWSRRASRVDRRDIVEHVEKAADELFDGKVARVGAEQFTPFERDDLLQSIDHALARAPGRARLPAPGHPPARLRAEEAEAGIQARGLRALRAMLDVVKSEVTRILMTVRVQSEEEVREAAGRSRSAPSTSATSPTRIRTTTAACRTSAAANRRRRRRRSRGGGGDGVVAVGDWRRAEGGPQRSVPVRQREEVQAVPRQAGLSRLA